MSWLSYCCTSIPGDLAFATRSINFVFKLELVLWKSLHRIHFHLNNSRRLFMANHQPLYSLTAALLGLLSIPTIAQFQANAIPPKVPIVSQRPDQTLIKLDGRPIYVQRNGTWQEAQLRGYRSSRATGTMYTVQYTKDNSIEENVPIYRIMPLEQAQQRGIAKTAYDLSSQAGVQQMLDAHNVWRKRAGVPPLTWSPQLASYAQEWANHLHQRNLFEHRRNLPYGENLAWAGGQQFSPERVVNLWGEEVKDYNYAANSCTPGKMCGHYTQIVWRKTQEVGCGMARGNGKEVWVCNYNPPGNYRGQRPY